MSDSKQQPRRPLGSRWWPLMALGIGLTLGLACVVLARAQSTDRGESTLDFRDFWLTARQFRLTGQIVSDQGVHNYLPFFPIFMTPWSLLPLPVAAALFSLLSMALFAGAVVMAEMALNGGLTRAPRPAMLWAIGLLLPYVWSCGVLGQFGLILTFLVVACWFLTVRGLEWEAGIALGLACLIKLFPAVLLLFFVLHRRWRVVASSAATLALLGLALPLLSLGWRGFLDQHEGFWVRAASGHSAYATLLADKPQKAKYNNSSLPIVLRRLFTPTDYEPREKTPPSLVNVLNLPRSTVWWLYVVLAALALTLSAACVARGGSGWPPSDLDQIRSHDAQFGAWCGLMLILSPLVWTHYLVLMYWPLAVLCDRLVRSQRTRDGAAPWIAAALLLWGVAIAGLGWPAARAAGAQLWGVVVIWASCVMLSVRAPINR